MKPAQALRSAVLDILERHGAIRTGALINKLHKRGFENLDPLWKLLQTLRDDGRARASGPATRHTWHFVPAAAPEPPQSLPPPRAPAQTVPDGAGDLEDPAAFLAEAATTPPQSAVPHAPRRIGRNAPTPRTTKYKNLTRCDYPEQAMIGYMVRVTWKHTRHQAFFSDVKYGDRLGALAAALDWRDHTERELGKPRTEQFVPGVTASNTGIQGVTRQQTKDGRVVLQVTWYDQGRQRRTSVSVRRHGEVKALALARAIRQRGEQQRLGRAAFAGLAGRAPRR